ncbi:MAG: DUF255 domain-containing protein [Chitinophagales bacterium]|nr:DUF255 domain-containing protein [Chitinophagales bacterium]
MKKHSPLVLLLVCLMVFSSYRPAEPKLPEAGGIKWMTWKEMQEAQKREPRKVFVDVYTDWCGWCKRMDQTTFVHPEIVKYLNENYYAIKFDAEERESIRFKGKDYKFVASGNRGYNELAAEILKGRMSYPTSVYLDENMDLLFPVPGYLEPKTLEQVLHFVGENVYKQMTFDIFQKDFTGKIK